MKDKSKIGSGQGYTRVRSRSRSPRSYHDHAHDCDRSTSVQGLGQVSRSSRLRCVKVKLGSDQGSVMGGSRLAQCHGHVKICFMVRSWLVSNDVQVRGGVRSGPSFEGQF